MMSGGPGIYNSHPFYNARQRLPQEPDNDNMSRPRDEMLGIGTGMDIVPGAGYGNSDLSESPRISLDNNVAPAIQPCMTGCMPSHSFSGTLTPGFSQSMLIPGDGMANNNTLYPASTYPISQGFAQSNANMDMTGISMDPCTVAQNSVLPEELCGYDDSSSMSLQPSFNAEVERFLAINPYPTYPANANANAPNNTQIATHMGFNTSSVFSTLETTGGGDSGNYGLYAMNAQLSSPSCVIAEQVSHLVREHGGQRYGPNPPLNIISDVGNSGFGHLPSEISQEMTRTPSQSRTITTDRSGWYGNPSPSTMSSAVPYSSPVSYSTSASNNGDLSEHPVSPKDSHIPAFFLNKFNLHGNNGKRVNMDATLGAEEGGRPHKRNKNSKTNPKPKACLACYLQHKSCLPPCPRCGPGKFYPYCISADIQEKNIFLECLNEDQRKAANEIISRKEWNGEPATRVVARYLGHDEMNLKSIMEVLSVLKFNHRNAHASFFQDGTLRQHTIFGPFYHVCLILQARALLSLELPEQKPCIVYNESDLQILQAVCASRIFQFINHSLEKNKMREKMPKGCKKARITTVFLAILLEQTLAFPKTMNEELDSMHKDLTYHLAFLLHHMAKSTFESGLETHVEISQDRGISLDNDFWGELSTAYHRANVVSLDGQSRNRHRKQSSRNPPVPAVIRSSPTFRTENGTLTNSREVIVPGDNAESNEADATSLLLARLRPREETTESLAEQLGGMHISEGDSHISEGDVHTSEAPKDIFYVGNHDAREGWQMGVPGELTEGSGSGSGGYGYGDSVDMGSGDDTANIPLFTGFNMDETYPFISTFGFSADAVGVFGLDTAVSLGPGQLDMAGTADAANTTNTINTANMVDVTTTADAEMAGPSAPSDTAPPGNYLRRHLTEGKKKVVNSGRVFFGGSKKAIGNILHKH